MSPCPAIAIRGQSNTNGVPFCAQKSFFSWRLLARRKFLARSIHAYRARLLARAWHMFDKRNTCNEQQRRRPIDTQETSFKRRLLSRRDANDSRNVMFRRNGNRKDRGDYDDSSPRWMTRPGSRNITRVSALFPNVLKRSRKVWLTSD